MHGFKRVFEIWQTNKSNIRFVMKRIYAISTTLIGLCIAFGLASAPKADAQSRGGTVAWKSSSGDLTLTLIDGWRRSCARGTASTGYQVRGGAKGLLYPTDCDADSMTATASFMRFEDSEGAERCTGQMKFVRQSSSDPVSAMTIWSIEAAVRGYSCTTVGQTFEVEVFNVQ